MFPLLLMVSHVTNLMLIGTFTCVAKHLVTEKGITGKYINLEPFCDQLGVSKNLTAIV